MEKEDIWKSFQNLSLGEDKAPLRLYSSILAREEEKRSRSIIVKGLTPVYQNPRYMKILLPEMWRMEGRVRGQVLDDGSIQFFFDSERDLKNIVDGGPWNFRDWLMVMDRWINRNDPNFLKQITLWVQIIGLPEHLRRETVAMDIGESLGKAIEAYVREPSNTLPAMVKVKVTMPITSKLLFSRRVDLGEEEGPTLLKFVYDRLRKFCRNCGALTHSTTSCGEGSVRGFNVIAGEGAVVEAIPRAMNTISDSLAKKARITNVSPTVKWTSSDQ